MASVRQRTRIAANGEKKSAWVVDYFDVERKRHLKTFPTERGAKAWLARRLRDAPEPPEPVLSPPKRPPPPARPKVIQIAAAQGAYGAAPVLFVLRDDGRMFRRTETLERGALWIEIK